MWQLTGTSYYPLVPYRLRSGSPCSIALASLQCVSPFMAQSRRTTPDVQCLLARGEADIKN
jgi:hypothetical protein